MSPVLSTIWDQISWGDEATNSQFCFWQWLGFEPRPYNFKLLTLNLHDRRDGKRHTIREYEVDTTLTLNSEIDYKHVRPIKILPGSLA